MPSAPLTQNIRELNGHDRDKVAQIVPLLGGQNCNRCGFRTCAENAAAMVRGESAPDSCVQAGPEAAARIREILGVRERVSLGTLVWEQLTSVKLAIALIILLVGISIVGTVIPQGKDPFFYIERYGQMGLNLISFLQVDKLFHSWYFLTLLALLSVNTLCCAIKRFRVSWEMVREPLTARNAEEIAELPGHVMLALKASSLEKLGQILSRKRYRLEQNGVQLWARKHISGRLGIDILHVSLIVILVGGLVGGLGGFEDFKVAHKGETFKIDQGNFEVRVDDLWSDSYTSSSQVKDWYTKLTVLDNGREVFTKTVQVNEPLSYKGISLYQSSFGTDWLSKAQLTFKIERTLPNVAAPDPNQTPGSAPSPTASPAKETTEITAEVGSVFALADGAYKAKIVAFYPDLAMGEQGPVNRSQRLNNPAAYLEVYKSEDLTKPEYATWTFAQYPEFQHEFAKDSQFRFFLSGMTAPEFTGLQVAYNPGIPLIYFGFAMLMLGMIMNFYLPPRRIWAAVKEGTLYLGGLGREPREFETDLEGIIEEYQRETQQDTPAADPKESEKKKELEPVH
jgi:cytochrome c biogenesis protein